MKYTPIFSKDIEKFENRNVSVIGKVVDIQEEKKILRIKLIDTFGYINIVFFEYFDIKLFDTIIILGKVSKYNDNFSIIGRYVVKLDEKEEILWRKFFIEKYKNKEKVFKKEEYNKKMKKENNNDENNVENVNIKSDDKNEELDYLENEEIKLRKEILEFIKNNDKGDGVSYDDILKFFELNEEKISNILKDLLSSGEIYESSPNKYKII
ncbi:hypothetical protein YN1_3540 [Nanoarchaeota archaeon]